MVSTTSSAERPAARDDTTPTSGVVESRVGVPSGGTDHALAVVLCMPVVLLPVPTTTTVPAASPPVRWAASPCACRSSLPPRRTPKLAPPSRLSCSEFDPTSTRSRSPGSTATCREALSAVEALAAGYVRVPVCGSQVAPPSVLRYGATPMPPTRSSVAA